ncbi:MAG: glycosyltransferase family 2 protein [Ignavibacteria bacterium]|nr:glycosyltransferase family 2 protein [Ignavibacteria bacterium]
MVSIIIPNYNGISHLKECFDSLRTQTYKNFKIHLVDNNSSDDSVKFTNENFPEIETVSLDSNTGFAKAVNTGIKYSLKDGKIKYIVLLNNDIECDKNFVSELLSGFKTNDTGSVASKMLNYYNRDIIDDAGDFIKKKGSPYARGHSEKDIGQYDKEEFIWGACAGAAIYKREVFNEIGLFDEDFFAYYEDVDFNFRMQLVGYKCYYNPKAVCFHKRGETFKDMTGLETMLCEKNLVALRIKNYPLNILLKWIPYFLVVRIRRYYGFIRNYSYKVFLSAVKGYLKGLTEIPKSLTKRRKIQRQMKVTPDYIENLFK